MSTHTFIPAPTSVHTCIPFWLPCLTAGILSNYRARFLGRSFSQSQPGAGVHPWSPADTCSVRTKASLRPSVLWAKSIIFPPWIYALSFQSVIQGCLGKIYEKNNSETRVS